MTYILYLQKSLRCLLVFQNNSWQVIHKPTYLGRWLQFNHRRVCNQPCRSRRCTNDSVRCGTERRLLLHTASNQQYAILELATNFWLLVLSILHNHKRIIKQASLSHWVAEYKWKVSSTSCAKWRARVIRSWLLILISHPGRLQSIPFIYRSPPYLTPILVMLYSYVTMFDIQLLVGYCSYIIQNKIW